MKSLPADLIVRPAHLQLALNLSDRALTAHILKGNVPHPDAKGHGGLKLWRIDTIRAWNPAIADSIETLLALPAFAPRPQRQCNTPLLAEAA
ncbi:MAG: hypothetical protein QG599_1109 [Pseudomonadota bacterium]|nr:hypothetical protein [Pseudomonadota bacterium]